MGIFHTLCYSVSKTLKKNFKGIPWQSSGQNCTLSPPVCMYVYVLVAQSCPTLCDPIDCSPPGSSVHGIPQARILEWLPFPSPGDLPDSGSKSGSPTLQADYLPSEPPEKPMKITVRTLNWSKLWTRRSKKDQKTPQTATSEELRVKIGYCACPLHTPTKEVKKHLSHPSSPHTRPAPTVSPNKEPPWGDN